MPPTASVTDPVEAIVDWDIAELIAERLGYGTRHRVAQRDPHIVRQWCLEKRLEEFIDDNWGEKASRTRAKNISILKGFFEWAVLSGRIYGDPARPIRPPKKRGVHRETFSGDDKALILATGPDPNRLHRDRCALRLRLKDIEYALRLAKKLGVDCPFGNVAAELYRKICAQGGGRDNESRIIDALPKN